METNGPPETHQPAKTPFRYELVADTDIPDDKQDVIQGLVSSPELTVRQLSSQRLLRNLGFITEAEPVDQLVEAGAIGRRLQTELETYHIRLPLRSLVVGHGADHQPVLYTVTDKIHGQSLEDALRADPSPISDDQLHELFGGLFNYYRDKQQTGDDFIIDLTYLGQYMYGRRKGETTDSIYCIDVDPFYGRGQQTTGQDRHEDDYEVSDIISSLPGFMEQTAKLIGRSPAPDIETAVVKYLDSQNIEPYYDQAA